ncbi:MAG: CBS domain-containing protein, partial [Methermicoccaceae archaeon]
MPGDALLRGYSMYDKKVEDVMSAPVFVISSNELLSRARNLMLKHRVSRLVVVEGEDPVGVITKT